MTNSNQHTKDEEQVERITQILTGHVKECLKFYDPKKENIHDFVDHVLSRLCDAVFEKTDSCEDDKSDCSAKSNDNHKLKDIEENEHINFHLNCALLSLERLFHTTTADLLKLSLADLEHKRKNALLLVKCLESVINLKKHRGAQ